MPHRRRFLPRASLLAPLFLCLLVVVTSAGAQDAHGHHEQQVTAQGLRLDFSEDGVWRVPARQVLETRERLRAEGRFPELNAALATPGAGVRAVGGVARTGAAVAGVMRVPTILVAFSDTNLGATFPRDSYQALLYGTEPTASNRPYTLRTFYEELSAGLMSLQGNVYGWVVAPEPATYYLEACGYDQNGRLIQPYNCTLGRARMGELQRHAILTLDAAGFRFGAYDGTGNGYVDVVQFVQPVLGQECGGIGIWAHRWQMRWTGGEVTTSDGIRFNDYTFQSGLGGTGCTASQMMGIGTMAHELGHGLGLPDLYDTGGQTAGAGAWDLMASGNWYGQHSPAHMGAWSKEQLGWVRLRELTLGGDYELGPVIAGDTVLLLRPRATNPRGEYFLLENRQPVGSDAEMLGSPRGPGLLIWHIDSVQVVTRRGSNAINRGVPPAIHGVAVVQADGLNNLRSTGAQRNAGDSGDPFPGSTGNGSFSAASSPPALLNDGGRSAGFTITGIRQLSPGGAVAFDLAMSGELIVQASRPEAQVRVNGVATHRWQGTLESGQSLALDIDPLQPSADGATALAFEGWSNGQPRAHTVTAPVETHIIEAAVGVRYRLRVGVEGEGTIAGAPEGALGSGAYVSDSQSITLVAQPAEGYTFYRWHGDRTGTSPTLTTLLTGPTDLTAQFRNWAPLVVTASHPDALVSVDGAASTRWQGQIANGQTRTLEIDSLQLTGDGDRAFGFVAWSNGGDRTHTITGPLGTDSVVATVDVRWRTRVRIDGQGTVHGAPEAAFGDGAYVLAGDSLTLVAMPADGHYFNRWLGAESHQATLVLPADRAREVTAVFRARPHLAADVVIDHLLGVGHGLDSAAIEYLDRSGNRNGRLDVGDVLAWLQQTAQTEAAARLLDATRTRDVETRP
jgi:M6 family metalloprotease-like protein